MRPNTDHNDDNNNNNNNDYDDDDDEAFFGTVKKSNNKKNYSVDHDDDYDDSDYDHDDDDEYDDDDNYYHDDKKKKKKDKLKMKKKKKRKKRKHQSRRRKSSTSSWFQQNDIDDTDTDDTGIGIGICNYCNGKKMMLLMLSYLVGMEFYSNYSKIIVPQLHSMTSYIRSIDESSNDDTISIILNNDMNMITNKNNQNKKNNIQQQQQDEQNNNNNEKKYTVITSTSPSMSTTSSTTTSSSVNGRRQEYHHQQQQQRELVVVATRAITDCMAARLQHLVQTSGSNRDVWIIHAHHYQSTSTSSSQHERDIQKSIIWMNKLRQLNVARQSRVWFYQFDSKRSGTAKSSFLHLFKKLNQQYYILQQQQQQQKQQSKNDQSSSSTFLSSSVLYNSSTTFDINDATTNNGIDVGFDTTPSSRIGTNSNNNNNNANKNTDIDDINNIKYPFYKFAWHLEDDSFFTGHWKTLFDYYVNDTTTDLYVGLAVDEYGKEKKKQYQFCHYNRVPCKKINTTKLGWPIARMSYRLVESLLYDYSIHKVDGHHEDIMAPYITGKNKDLISKSLSSSSETTTTPTTTTDTKNIDKVQHQQHQPQLSLFSTQIFNKENMNGFIELAGWGPWKDKEKQSLERLHKFINATIDKKTGLPVNNILYYKLKDNPLSGEDKLNKIWPNRTYHPVKCEAYEQKYTSMKELIRRWL